MCLNTERMMTMFFSEELKILDDNTVKYMVDQLEESNKEKDATIAELNAEKAAFLQLIDQLDDPNADKEAILAKFRKLK